MTLAELMVASVVMVMIAGALASISMTVEKADQISVGGASAAQHARVVIDRVQRTVEGAYANETFPGCLVITTTESSYTFPDTLVVWAPVTGPVNTSGLPLWSEVTVYSPDSSNPNRLMEYTNRSKVNSVPAVSNTSSWRSTVQSFISDAGTTKTELTDLLRTAQTSSSKPLRGAIRFHAVHSPSAAEWTSYKAGSTDWEDLSWAQDIFGPDMGLRQTWCSFEMQLVRGTDAFQTDPSGATSLPFFGSAAIYYQLSK